VETLKTALAVVICGVVLFGPLVYLAINNTGAIALIALAIWIAWICRDRRDLPPRQHRQPTNAEKARLVKKLWSSHPD